MHSLHEIIRRELGNGAAWIYDFLCKKEEEEEEEEEEEQQQQQQQQQQQFKKYKQKTITKPFQCCNGENKFKDTLKKFPTHTQTKQKEKFYYTKQWKVSSWMT